MRAARMRPVRSRLDSTMNACRRFRLLVRCYSACHSSGPASYCVGCTVIYTPSCAEQQSTCIATTPIMRTVKQCVRGSASCQAWYVHAPLLAMWLPMSDVSPLPLLMFNWACCSVYRSRWRHIVVQGAVNVETQAETSDLGHRMASALEACLQAGHSKVHSFQTQHGEQPAAVPAQQLVHVQDAGCC